MKYRNCWEIEKCGREPCGVQADSRGVCIAATEERFDQINHGINGGRICWLIRQKLSERNKKGLVMMQCCRCDFYKLVEKEEGPHFFVYP
jgi:hypothetical protein